MRRWHNGVKVFLGVWVLISPWVLGFGTAPAATWTTTVLGAAIVVLAGTAAFEPKTWQDVMTIVLGLAVMVSPWLLGVAPGLSPATSAEIAGVLVSSLGIWAIAADPIVLVRRQKRSETS